MLVGMSVRDLQDHGTTRLPKERVKWPRLETKQVKTPVLRKREKD
jgi:hypothetical protein